MMERVILHPKEFEEMSQRFRATFFNSLSGFKSLGLIGTINQDGITNLATFNSIVHIGAFPPLLGMIFRPDTVRRHTLENILTTNNYTINHVHESMLQGAHQASAKYEDRESEFTACGFTEEYTEVGIAPYVKESSIKMLLEYRMHIPIPLNDTILLIGEIKEVIAPTSSIKNDGFVDMQSAGTLTVAGLDAYYSTQLIDLYAYARPFEQAQSLINSSERNS